MDTSTRQISEFQSVFDSWSYSPDACLLHEASLHVKSSFWNPTFGAKAWLLSDYMQYSHVFIQLEMLLKEKVRCILGINVGITNLDETIAIQDYFIQDLRNTLSLPNDPLKEARLLSMWKDMEEFASKGIALKTRKNKPIKNNKPGTLSVPNTRKSRAKIKETKEITTMANTVEKDRQQEPIKLDILNPVKELPYYWKMNQNKLSKLEKKLNSMLKSSTFKFLRQVSKDKNKIIINLFEAQNLSGKFTQDYNIFPTTRIYRTNEELISGLINYKYKRKRQMSEDAKDASYINVFNHLKVKDEEQLDEKEKVNRKLAIINQVDMALKYNNVLKVKQLMSEDDFLLVSEQDKNSINLKSRLAALELYEIKQAMEKEKMEQLAKQGAKKEMKSEVADKEVNK